MYQEKLMVLNWEDPYEIPRECWKEDLDLWPAIIHMHVGLYLLLNPSPYSVDDLHYYKSLDCYIIFISGWVREILVKKDDGKELLLKRYC